MQRDSHGIPFAANTGSSQATSSRTPRASRLGTGVGKDNGLDSNFNESGTGLFNSNSWTERADYTINEKMHAFERFSRFWDTLSGAVMFGAAGGPGFGIGNYGGNSNGANDSLASGMDIAISPKLLTDFRLGYYRYNVIDTKHDQGTEFANTLGIPGINIGGNITSGSPGFNITNLPGGSGGTNGTVYGDGLNVNRCNCPLTEREDQFQIVNNWTMIKGNHTFKVGADLRYGRNLRVPSDNDRAGLLNFNVGPTSNPDKQYRRSWICHLHAGRRNQLQPLRLHLHQRQGIPEAHLLLRTGHLARNQEPDPEPRPSLGTLLPRDRQRCRATDPCLI